MPIACKPAASRDACASSSAYVSPRRPQVMASRSGRIRACARARSPGSATSHDGSWVEKATTTRHVLRAGCYVRTCERAGVRTACRAEATEQGRSRRRMLSAATQSPVPAPARTPGRGNGRGAPRPAGCAGAGRRARRLSRRALPSRGGLRFRGRSGWAAGASDSAPSSAASVTDSIGARPSPNSIATRPFQASDASSHPANSAPCARSLPQIVSRRSVGANALHLRQVEEVRHCRPPARQPGPSQVGECRLLVERRRSRPQRPGIERVEDDAVGQARDAVEPFGQAAAPPHHRRQAREAHAGDRVVDVLGTQAAERDDVGGGLDAGATSTPSRSARSAARRHRGRGRPRLRSGAPPDRRRPRWRSGRDSRRRGS